MKIRVTTDKHEYQGVYKDSIHYVEDMYMDMRGWVYIIKINGRLWKFIGGEGVELLHEECRSPYCECEEGKCSGGKVDMRADEAEKKASVLDIQHGGSHYKDKGIQPIEYITANNLGFCEGNIVKYASRHQDKNGAEDIRKVIHYAQFILKFQYNEDI